MPVITKTVKKLILGAYKKIGMFAEDDPTGQTNFIEALDILNDILDEFSSTPSKIAYDKTITFPIVSGQQSYTFSKLGSADVDSERIVALKIVNIIDGSNIYPVQIRPDTYFFNNFRTVTGGTIPGEVFLQNANETSTLTFFTVPDRNLTGEIKAKFDLQHVTLNQVLNEVPAYYFRFLQYALAHDLADEFDGTTWNNRKELKYRSLRRAIIGSSDLNIDIETNGILVNRKESDSNAIFRGY